MAKAFLNLMKTINPQIQKDLARSEEKKVNLYNFLKRHMMCYNITRWRTMMLTSYTLGPNHQNSKTKELQLVSEIHTYT